MPGSQGSGPRVNGRGLREAPVEYSGHVFCGAEIPPQRGFMEVEEWVLTGFSRQREQVCSEGRPRRLAGEFRNDLVGLAVERRERSWGPTSCSAATLSPSV